MTAEPLALKSMVDALALPHPELHVRILPFLEGRIFFFILEQTRNRSITNVVFPKHLLLNNRIWWSTHFSAYSGWHNLPRELIHLSCDTPPLQLLGKRMSQQRLTWA